MTATTYTWNVQDIILDGDMESWTVGTPDNWTESGTVTEVTGFGGGSSARLAASSTLYQELEFTEYSGGGATYDGRRVDSEEPHMLRFQAQPAGTQATWPCRLKVQLHLLDENSDHQYVYNWFKTKWEIETTEGGGAYYNVMLLENDSWDKFVLPWIQAPVAASTDVADDWFLRVTFETASDAIVEVDDVELFPWTGSNIAVKLGGTGVFSNGRNYPVRYDPRSGSVVELSLTPPYQTANSAIPTTTQGTSGSLGVGLWYGWGFTFYDEELGEESGMPYGAFGDSGLFYEQMSGANDSMTIDFSIAGFHIPNTENDPATDNARVDKHFVYRTVGHETEDAVKTAMASGSWHYEGSGTAGASFSSTLGDDALPDAGQVVNRVHMPNRLPAPGFSIATINKNRLYVAGGATYRLGSGIPSNGTKIVTGVTTGTTPYTQWSRVVDGMFLQFDGEGERYTIERFVPADDLTGTEEKIYLRDAYVGSNSAATSYRIFPENGKVMYSEEGDPTTWTADNYFSLAGDAGEAVTMLLPSGIILLAATRSRTFGWAQETDDADGVDYATPLSNEIGCIAPGSAVEIRGVGYWLSDEGVVRFSQGRPPEIISNQIQSIFTDVDDQDYIVRDPVTRLASFARGAHYPSHQQYLLAVKTVNAKVGCDMVLAYNYFFETWDLWRLRSELLDWSWSVDDDGNAVLLFTDAIGGMHIWDRGSADGAGHNKGGAPTGAILAATAYSAQLVSDSSLYTDGEGLKGATFYIKSGDGKGQWRTITRNNASSVYWAEVLDAVPDTDSTYEVGGIEFEWNFKDSDFALPGAVKVLRNISIDHRQEGLGGLAEVRVFSEFSKLSLIDDEGYDILNSSFEPAVGGRSMVTAHQAAGYNLRLQIKHDGPERPLSIRRLSASLTIRESD